MKDKITIILSIILIALVFYSIRRVYIYKCNQSYRDKYNIKYNTKEIELLENKLNIIEPNYNWSEPLEYNNVPTIIIFHHTAIKEISPEDINELHQSKGWKCIGYHYYIRKDGQIYRGRPETAEGSHTYSYNLKSIGIAVEGNFEEEYLTQEQIDSLVQLSEYICLKYDVNSIIGHKNVGNTLCPGKNFPVEEIKNIIINNLKTIK